MKASRDSMRRKPQNGFTLIELLVVIAIIAILAAILFPVFAKAREKARQITCASNMRQLGIGLIQYTQDYDECFPVGNWANGTYGYRGKGWAGEIYSYVKSTGAYKCPDDPTVPVAIPAGLSVVSYGYNSALCANLYNLGTGGVITTLKQPTKTVLLFEVTGDGGVNLADPTEQSLSTTNSTGGTGYGKDYNLFAFVGTNNAPVATPTPVAYATGFMDKGATLSNDNTGGHYPQQYGIHSQGSNFAFVDGHVKWLMGSQLSPGLQAPTSTTLPSGNTGNYNAAGTDVPGYAGTFSPI